MDRPNYLCECGHPESRHSWEAEDDRNGRCQVPDCACRTLRRSCTQPIKNWSRSELLEAVHGEGRE